MIHMLMKSVSVTRFSLLVVCEAPAKNCVCVCVCLSHCSGSTQYLRMTSRRRLLCNHKCNSTSVSWRSSIIFHSIILDFNSFFISLFYVLFCFDQFDALILPLGSKTEHRERGREMDSRATSDRARQREQLENRVFGNYRFNN